MPMSEEPRMTMKEKAIEIQILSMKLSDLIINGKQPQGINKISLENLTETIMAKLQIGIDRMEEVNHGKK